MGPTQPHWVPGFFLKVKQPKHEVYHSSEVKNDWLYTSTPPKGLHGVYRENFHLPLDLPAGIQEMYVLVTQPWQWEQYYSPYTLATQRTPHNTGITVCINVGTYQGHACRRYHLTHLTSAQLCRSTQNSCWRRNLFHLPPGNHALPFC
jgi:hypothetical protein